MGVSYWAIIGIGIDAERLYPYLNPVKCAEFLNKEQDDLHFTPEMCTEDKLQFYLRDLECPFEHFADMLTFCDDTDTLTFSTDECGDSYFYYPPSFPWDAVKNEPKSLEEVHQRIANAVNCLCDISREELEGLIDNDLYIICGA